MSRMTNADARIGQAVYTWVKDLPFRPAGYRFVAVSPEWESRMPWLEASTRSLTGFVGNDKPVSAQDRESYRPVGRHVHSGMALAYRKQDAGLDGHNRPGNYVVHFLMTAAWSLGMTDVLTMPGRWWMDVDDARLKPSVSLQDIELSDFRDTLHAQSEVGVADPSRVVKAVRELARKKSASANGWAPEDILALLATMPPWADYAMRLVPEWSELGASQRLKLADVPPAEAAVEDRRWFPVDDELEKLRHRLSGARNIVEVGQLLSGQQLLSGELAGVPLGGADVRPTQLSLDSTVLKWMASGARGLSVAEIDLMEREPLKTLSALDEKRQRIPVSRRLDMIALALLERCDGVDRRLLARVLPIDDEAVSMYVAKCPNRALVEAAVLLNCDGSRAIDLVMLGNVAPGTMHHLVELSRVDPEIYDGLVRSVSISSLRGGTFARRLFLTDGMDFEYLFARILPAAARGRTDSLLSLACINPDAFVSWIGIPEPYAEALVEALRHETRQAIWERISGFFGRWRRGRGQLGGDGDDRRP